MEAPKDGYFDILLNEATGWKTYNSVIGIVPVTKDTVSIHFKRDLSRRDHAREYIPVKVSDIVAIDIRRKGKKTKW